MKTIFSALILFFGFITSIVGQDYFEINGKILDRESKEAIPFANIYNINTKRGTISNAEGFFRIFAKEPTDTILITCIGYTKHQIRIQYEKGEYLIYLEKKITLLNEISVTPQNNDYLYELIQETKKSVSNTESKSKAYYELKSFIDGKQIELVECYFNLDVKGYKLLDLKLKEGRIALRSDDNRFFASLESSRAIILLDIFEGNNYFPTNPVELSSAKLRRHYSLTLENKYLDDMNDSVYVINFKPKDSAGNFFEGELWINKTKHRLKKVTLKCNNTLKHPFLPLFPIDEILNVSFNITQTFDVSKDQVVFNHTDFFYKIDYVSRVGKAEEQNYSIETNAVLYAYDYGNSFFLPFFDFKDYIVGDYRRISAMPYNEFFWTYNDEYSIKDRSNKNEIFYNDSAVLTNTTFFKSNILSKYGFFEFPYVTWSKDRILLHANLFDTTANTGKIGFKSEQYKLAIKIYLDVNTYNDSTQILTSTIIDPYESFYYLPIDNQTNCFLNIYFDLFEIGRQELQKKLEAERNNIGLLKGIYDVYLTQLGIKMNEYLYSVDRGTNEEELIKYNKLVYEKLGIDNIKLFQTE